jgi:hypothetical protein
LRFPATRWFGISGRPFRQEDIVRELLSDFGVAADDDGQRLPFHESNQLGGKVILVPEAVTVAQAGELIDEDLVIHGADHRAAQLGFTKPADPTVDLVDVVVDGRHDLPHFRVGIDVAKSGGGANSELAAGGVEAGESVIAPALNVEGGEIEAS